MKTTINMSTLSLLTQFREIWSRHLSAVTRVWTSIITKWTAMKLNAWSCSMTSTIWRTWELLNAGTAVGGDMSDEHDRANADAEHRNKGPFNSLSISRQTTVEGWNGALCGYRNGRTWLSSYMNHPAFSGVFASLAQLYNLTYLLTYLFITFEVITVVSATIDGRAVTSLLTWKWPWIDRECNDNALWRQTH